MKEKPESDVQIPTGLLILLAM